VKRVLLTGASGFIGRHTVPRLLERGYEVHAVGRSGVPAPGACWHKTDLLDHAQARSLVMAVRPSHLLHLAWYAEHRKFWTSPENLRWVTATENLLDFFAYAGGRRAVVAGTCAEYDWSRGECDESTTPLAPATRYGICKDSTRASMDAWSRRTGVSGSWGRIFHLYGPYEHPDRLVPSIICALLRDEDARCTHGRQLRDFLHVEDVASAFVALLDSDVAGAVNIGSGAAVSIADVAERIAGLLGRQHRLKLGALEAPPDDPARLLPVVRRLMDELQWRPRHGLDDGLRHTIEWWRAHLQRNVETGNLEANY